ncbi:AMP-dependent synthetase and ligase [Parafrankia sp. EAN1pec]|uniref:AMP-binding protein n=1 Tax=Parafrankia sp. (strain EAN1pec) TaxID=298653 RepID=UPI0000541C3B|nr:AMP-dependent synthetase and ligase [Frankia sp. EAN1pec]
MRVRAHRQISAPVDVVWDVVTDHEGMSTWFPGVAVALERPGVQGGIGAVRIVRMTGLSIREQVTDIEPARRLAYRCISGHPLRDYRGEIFLAPSGTGTSLTWVLDTSTRFRLVAWLLVNQARLFAWSLARAAERSSALIRSADTDRTKEPAVQHVQSTASTQQTPGADSSPGPASLAEAFQRNASRDPQALALSTPDGSATLTWGQYAEQVRDIAAALHAHGVRRGDSVALMMLNRPEFYPIDTAAIHLGAIPFSIYNTSSAEQIRWLFASAKPSMVFCDSSHAAAVLEAVDGGTAVKAVVCVDGDVEGATTSVEFRGVRSDDFDFESTWRSVTPDDVLTLIYTSGTTGEPKGVQITHGNMLAQLAATNTFLEAGPGDRVISFLPSAHIADRWAAHYLQLVCGTTVYPLVDRTQLLPTMLRVRPTLFGAVPQVWQKIRAGVLAMIDAEADEERQAGIQQTLAVGARYARSRSDGTLTAELESLFATADTQVLSHLRSRLGLDQARIVMSGAAAVPVEIVEFFNSIGVPLIDGWGMSELSCMGAFMPNHAPRLGSVGMALPGVQVRLGEDGELLVRGPIVMKGYLGRPELTAELIDDEGWLYTGDVARIDDEGYIYIIDRKKEIIVNSSGKNISPAGIEGHLKAASPLIGQAVVIGEARPFLTALIVLDADAAGQYAASRALPADASSLAADEGVVAALSAAVTEANTHVSQVEHVRKFAVLPQFWEPGSELLTHTMKLRRRPIGARYADVIEALYRLPRDESVLRIADAASAS